MLLVDVGAGVPCGVLRLHDPVLQLLEERSGLLRAHVLRVPVGSGHVQRPTRTGHRDVGGPPLLVFLLLLQVLLEGGEVAVVAREVGGVTAELEVHRLAAFGRIVLDRGVRQEPFREPGHEDVIELEALGNMDRHDLDGVLLGGLDGGPFLLVQVLDGVDVLEERAKGELTPHGGERVHLVEERR